MDTVSGLKRLARPRWSIPLAVAILTGLGAAAFAVIRNDEGSGAEAEGRSRQVQSLENAQVAAAFVGATADGAPVAIVESPEGELAARVGDNNEYAGWIAGERDGDALRFEGDEVVLKAWEEKDGLRATLTVDGVEESLWLSPAAATSGGGDNGSGGAGAEEGIDSSYD